jgi:hypothetical protein
VFISVHPRFNSFGWGSAAPGRRVIPLPHPVHPVHPVQKHPFMTKSVMIQTPLQPPLSAQLSQKIIYLYDILSQPAAYEQLTTKNRSRKLSLIEVN